MWSFDREVTGTGSTVMSALVTDCVHNRRIRDCPVANETGLQDSKAIERANFIQARRTTFFTSLIEERHYNQSATFL